MKVVINKCYGGFGLSPQAEDLYAKKSGFELDDSSWDSYNIDRSDKTLVEVVEELGEKANGVCADLFVIEIPDGIDWEVSEYDGYESIEESHRSWS